MNEIAQKWPCTLANEQAHSQNRVTYTVTGSVFTCNRQSYLLVISAFVCLHQTLVGPGVIEPKLGELWGDKKYNTIFR